MAPTLLLRLNECCPAHYVRLFVIFSPEPEVTKIGRRKSWAREIAALGDTKCSLMVLQITKNLVIKPGRMTKFEGGAYISRQTAEKLVQKPGIIYKIRRKLEQNGSEL